MRDDSSHEIDNGWLTKAKKDLQIAAMLDWFAARFWDPANETPYVSSEGGYIWVHGGPYDAREQLEERFDGIVPENVIEAATELVESDGIYEWALTPLTYYDEEQDVFVDDRNEPTKRLDQRLKELLLVLALRGDQNVMGTARKLVFAGVMAALKKLFCGKRWCIG